MDVSHLINEEKWSLLYSLSIERIEKERINIPVAAFRFWERQDFKELLNEVLDKSAFLNMQPEIASKFFDQKSNKPMTGY